MFNVKYRKFLFICLLVNKDKVVIIYTKKGKDYHIKAYETLFAR